MIWHVQNENFILDSTRIFMKAFHLLLFDGSFIFPEYIPWLYFISSTSLVMSITALLFRWREEPMISFSGNFQRTISTKSFIFLFTITLNVQKWLFTEFLLFVLTATLGGMFLCGANDLITIFVAPECFSLCSYLLSGYTKKDVRSNEATTKYLLMGGTSSSILVHGFSWLYGSSGGEIELQEIVNGIGFKLSPAPSHQWTPDVYEGVRFMLHMGSHPSRDYECNRSIRRQKDHPKMIISWLLRTNQIRWFYFSIFLTCSYGIQIEKIEKISHSQPLMKDSSKIVAFLSVTSKVAASASATRIFDIPLYFSSNEWHLLLEILAILSMILGNLIAITQTSMKRMLAYSSIGQLGYVIIGIIVGDSNDGYASMITYMLFYISMNLGTFACIVLFALCLLSLGGLPPLAGFFGKLYLFWCGWQAGLYSLVLIGLLTSVLSIYYYLKIIKLLMTGRNQEITPHVQNYRRSPLRSKNSIELSMIVCVIASTIPGISMNPIIAIAQDTLF
ncbi:hypothetical protein RND81_O136100 [Saponaria officinalis]|uniref:NADH-plastoquinone oxidoreductase subunit 2 n=1 Tax=Saponaria officinalis TaxID=3572 RepID=A0AAW1GIX3_SAPOF